MDAVLGVRECFPDKTVFLKSLKVLAILNCKRDVSQGLAVPQIENPDLQ